MTDYKLVPAEPTAEMVEAAQDAYMPFGDMDLALRMAILSAPAVQGEPVGESLARRFHEIYERLDPTFGYQTRDDTKQFDPKSANGRLMVAVCKEILAHPLGQLPAPDVAGLVEALEAIAEWVARWTSPGHPIENIARQALAAHRKQQEDEV